MVATFNPSFSYRAALDVRDWENLAHLVQDHEPSGLFWPLVGTRRSGKTWALKGVRDVLGREKSAYVDLGKRAGLDKVSVPAQVTILIDEPGRHLFKPATVAGGGVR